MKESTTPTAYRAGAELEKAPVAAKETALANRLTGVWPDVTVTMM
jgi:hypothetical protein